MPSKYQEYRQMADTAERRFTSSYKSWTQFLRTAARLYKYPYNEQVMPRPEISTPATARPGIPYYDSHESDIIIHKAAKKAFDDLALKTLPTVKSLQAEYSDLLVQKKLDYAGLAKARDEAKQLQIYKANTEILLRTDAEEQRQTRARQQEK